MRFSRRLPAVAETNEIARAIQQFGAPSIDLTESNPTRAGVSPGTQEIREALSNADTSHYEPEPRGLLRAREAVAAEYSRRGFEIGSERIFLTASSSESYSFLFKLLCDPGDSVAAPEPSYPLLEYLAGLEAVVRAPYRLRRRPDDGGWRLDAAEVERALDENARAVLLVQPNNPTGTLLSRRELARVDRLAESRGAALISDEVFLDYARPGDPGSAVPAAAAGTRTLAFSLGGLSKSCGLPQMKLGWIAVGGEEIRAREAMERLEHIADAYLSVGTPVQAALPALFGLGRRAAGRIRERVGANREALSSLLSEAPPESGVRLEASEGGWSAVVELPDGIDETRFVVDLLREDGVLVHPGWFFDFPVGPVIVLSLLPEPHVFLEGVLKITARMASGSPAPEIESSPGAD